MKKLILLFILIILALPFTMLAQDGSTPNADEAVSGIVPATITTSTPRSAEVQSLPATTAPREGASQLTTSTPEAIPSPILSKPAPTAPTLETPKATAPNKNKNDSAGLWVTLASFAAFFLGYALTKSLKKKNAKEKKKDDSRCLNIKKLMEKKFDEITDLRGQLQSKTEEKARKKIKGFLEGTSAEKIIEFIEKAEKEHERFKKLYEECIIEVETKTILVDAVGAFVIEGEGIFKNMQELLEKYPNKKIILTNADDEQMIRLGLTNLPYELFTLKHNPDKTNPEYFHKMLGHFNLSKDAVVYFEHNKDAVKSAESVGITAYHYDSDKKDLAGLKRFLDENL